MTDLDNKKIQTGLYNKIKVMGELTLAVCRNPNDQARHLLKETQCIAPQSLKCAD